MVVGSWAVAFSVDLGRNMNLRPTKSAARTLSTAPHNDRNNRKILSRLTLLFIRKSERCSTANQRNRVTLVQPHATYLILHVNVKTTPSCRTS